MLAGWSPRKAVELALAIEERGEANYRGLAARWLEDESLRRLVSRLSGEEAAHQEGFRTLLARAAPVPVGASALEWEKLREIAEVFFHDRDGFALSGIEKLGAGGEILEKILACEKSTLHFHDGLRDLLGSDATLDRMSHEEQRHVEEVTRVLRQTGIPQVSASA